MTDGAVAVSLPTDLSRGRHLLTVDYLGDDRHLPSSTSVTLHVKGGGKPGR